MRRGSVRPGAGFCTPGVHLPTLFREAQAVLAYKGDRSWKQVQTPEIPGFGLQQGR